MHAQREIAGVDDERGTYEVAIDGVPHPPPSSLNLNDDAQLVVHRVDLIAHALSAAFTEEDGTSNLLVPALSALDFIANLREPGSQGSQHAVARKTGPVLGVDALPSVRDDFDELLDLLEQDGLVRVDRTPTATPPSRRALPNGAAAWRTRATARYVAIRCSAR